MHFAAISDNVPEPYRRVHNTKWKILCDESRRLEIEAIKAFTDNPPDAQHP